jgi:cyclopropane-fatty-acyl-phospholipid synthase
MKIAERIGGAILAKAGIVPNGNAPWDIKINDPRFYCRVLLEGSLGLGESYMEGWWDCERLDQFFARILRTGEPLFAALSPIALAMFFKSHLMNLAPKSKAFVIGEKHYDLGNDFFQAMLDPATMSYSCGYFKNVSSLRDAQVAKLDLICHKLHLRPGQRVLEIGCGWGSFAHHAVTRYGVSVVGLTVSKEQTVLARERCKGLPVKIQLRDYRDLYDEQFDRVVSIGMFEHVEPKNYRTYMRVVEKCLHPEGLFLLHTIGKRGGIFNSPDPWIRKYIFPVGQIPTRRQIEKSSEGFSIIDWHEFGQFYDLTLMAWHKQFSSAWGELQAAYGEKVDGKFRRMWEYYLLACAGAFRARNLELWQMVLCHPDMHRAYRSVR